MLHSLQCCTEFALICKNSQVDSAVFAGIVFGGNLPNKHYKLVTQSSEHVNYKLQFAFNGRLEGSDEEKMTLKPDNNVTSGCALRSAGAGDEDAVWKTMIAAFGALSLSTATAAKKRRLSFLRRIVRTSFLRRCQRMGLAVNSVSPQTQPLTVLYKMPIDVSENEWDDEVTEFAVYKAKLTLDQLVCPLCDTLGHLNTKEMLKAHLEWDHSEVETSWRERKNGVSRSLHVGQPAHKYRAGSLCWSSLAVRCWLTNGKWLNHRGE